jgi:hypothetical protein
VELISRGARITSFFTYDITRRLERGIASKMHEYNSNFPEALAREKLNFRIAKYYQEP